MTMLETPAKIASKKSKSPYGEYGQENKISPESLIESMHLTGNQKAQLERIVLAGQKVMFSEKSHRLMLEQLDGPGPIAQKIGQGVAGLIALLRQESRGSLPPELLILAWMILCAVVAQFLREAGQDVSDQDIGVAIETMTNALLHASGVDPDKLSAIASQGAKPEAGQAEQATTEEAQ